MAACESGILEGAMLEFLGSGQHGGGDLPALWDRVERVLADSADHLMSTNDAVFSLRNRRRDPRFADGFTPTWEPGRFRVHLNAFLVVTRSVAFVLQVTYGKDLGHPAMRHWWASLPSDEQARREQFHLATRAARGAFQAEALGPTRDEVIHRTGTAPAWVVVENARVPLDGDIPMERIVTPPPDAPPWFAVTRPLAPPQRPDFGIATSQGDMPLFDACEAYLRAARALADVAQPHAIAIHDGHVLTPPPAL